MRILYSAGFDVSLPQGHAVHVRRLCEALERRGHEVRLLARAPRGPESWPGPSGGLVFTREGAVPKLRPLASEWAAARRLRGELARYRPALHLARAEAFTLAPLVTRSPATPLVVECNSAPEAFLRAGGAPGWASPLVRRAERALLRSADAIGAVTPALLDRTVALHGLERDRLFLVPNGAWIPPDPGEEALRLRRRLGVDEGDFLLAFAGNLHPVQGLDLVLEAMARVAPASAPFHFWIVGGSPERSGLKRQAVRLGLRDRVRFTGGLPEEVAVLHLQAAQAVVAPYRVSDLASVCGDPLKLLQGLAADRPVLACAHGGLESLTGNAAFRRVERDDVVAWTTALRAIAEEWSRAGRPLRNWPWPEGSGPGREWVRTHRTWDHTAAAWEPVFARALSSSERRSR